MITDRAIMRWNTDNEIYVCSKIKKNTGEKIC